MVCGSYFPAAVSVYEQQRLHAFGSLQDQRDNGHIFTVTGLKELNGVSIGCYSAKASRESESPVDVACESASDDGSPVSRLATLSAYNEDAACEIMFENNNGHEPNNCLWLIPAVTAFAKGALPHQDCVSMQTPVGQAAQLVAELSSLGGPTYMQDRNVEDVPHDEAGNLANKLIQKLETSGSARHEAVAQIRGSVQELSFDPAGCRVVQLALKVVDTDTAAELVSELKGWVKGASQSASANYVIQRAIEVLPNAITGFVAEELLSSACAVAQHRFGCRVLCRLLEHSAKHPSVLLLANELVKDPLTLSRHEYGHYVMQALVEHGGRMHQQLIAKSFAQEFAFRVEDGSCSYVLESMFLHCGSESLDALLRPLLSGGSFNLEACTHSVCGIRVLRAVVKTQSGQNPQLLQRLMALAPKIRQCSQGHRLLQEVKQAKKQGSFKPRF